MPDDLSRNVYCILGMPIDAIEMPSVLHDIETAAANKVRFFISTPNLNFLVNAQSNAEFAESLRLSDLCPADGMPIVWIAQLLGVPIKTRIAGSDIFDTLKNRRDSEKPLTVFLFGGAEGVAAAACRALNVARGGLYCVGSLYPGFCSVDEMSGDDTIDTINSSGADFLVASLGAQKGQLWLQRNHRRLMIPIRVHLGAVINFQAATLRRAPPVMRRTGLEWLWRVKEEPHLWRRYWDDGRVLLRLMLTRVVPLAIWTWWLRLRYQRPGNDLVVEQTQDHESVTVSLSGPATAPHIDRIIPVLRDAIATKKQIIIDLSDTCAVDARFLGLLLMMMKRLKGSGAKPIFRGLSPGLKSIFRLNGVAFLLSAGEGV